MKKKETTVSELKCALEEIALMASVFLHHRPRLAARQELARAITKANQLLRSEVVGDLAGDHLPRSAEELIRKWIAQGGNYYELRDTMNHRALHYISAAKLTEEKRAVQ